jgi:hypothetical protein
LSSMHTGTATTDSSEVYPTGRSVGTSATTPRRSERVSTETKSAFKTTEFFVYILSVAGVLIASLAVGTNNHTGSGGSNVADYFRADKAWVLITILSVGYMLARGIAKSGSRDYYDRDRDGDRG